MPLPSQSPDTRRDAPGRDSARLWWKPRVGPQRTFAVVGLGRFGRAVCQELIDSQKSVIAIDKDAHLVEMLLRRDDRFKSAVTVSVDSTVEEELKEAGALDVDTFVVALGEPLEASLTTTYIAKHGTSSGVKMVCSRASSVLHERMLKAVGADKVTFPSREQGRQLGEQLVRPSLLDRLQLDSKNSIEEVQVPKEFIQRSLRDINLRKDYGVSVLAAGSQGDLRVNPPASMILSPNDVLVVMGSQEDIKRIHHSSDN